MRRIGGYQDIGAGGIIGLRDHFTQLEATSEASTIQEVQSPFAQANFTSSSLSRTISVGVEFPDREVWVAIAAMSRSGSIAADIADMRLNGTALEAVFKSVPETADTNNVVIGFYRLRGFVGTSGTLTVDFVNAGTSSPKSIVHYGGVVFTSTPTTRVIDTARDDANDQIPSLGAMDFGQGWAVSFSMAQNGASGTIPNFDTQISFDAASNEWCVFGYSSPADGTSKAIEMHSGAANGQFNHVAAFSME